MGRANNKFLQSAFKGINRAFFNNRLDPNIPVSFKRMRCLGQTRQIRFQRPVTRKEMREKGLSKEALVCSYILRIYISERLRHSGSLCVGTLLHEMVHAEMFQNRVGGHHKRICLSGRWNKFNKRMLKLAKAGAFNGLW